MKRLGIFAAIFAVLAVGSGAFAAGDAVRGETIFKKCASCHKIGEGAKNSVGPVLTDVVGRTAGSFEGYKFGKSIRAAGEAGLVWDEEQLIAYLEDPKKYLRSYLDDRKAKAKMTFKLKKLQDREDVVAFLSSLQLAQICVTNNADGDFLFVAENADGERASRTLGENATLCLPGSKGTVAVFEDEDAQEGCTKIASSERGEILRSYASFDNCNWE